MIGKTILHYKITEKRIVGGMSVVYKAEDTKLKHEAAIKLVKLIVLFIENYNEYRYIQAPKREYKKK